MPVPSVFELLDRYTADDRPRAVTLALRQLARRAAKDFVIIARLSHEAHDRGYWSKVSRPDGTPYLSEEAFFEDVLNVTSWRTALKRISVGRALEALPEETRAIMGARLADIGAAKAAIIAPALEAAPQTIEAWVARAAEMPAQDLQKAVSSELGAMARGLVAGDRVEAFIRASLPDLASRELFDDFLTAGRRQTGSESCLGVLIVAMQECVAQWSDR